MTAPVPINFNGVFVHVIEQIAISLGPALITVGAFMIGIAFLKNWALRPLLRYVATEFDSDMAKETYYDLYIYPDEDSPLARKKKRYEKRRDAWINSTEIFTKENNYDEVSDMQLVSSENGIDDGIDTVDYDINDFSFIDDEIDKEEYKEYWSMWD